MFSFTVSLEDTTGQLALMKKKKNPPSRISKPSFLSLCSKDQLKELAYGPRNQKQAIPIQYIWSAGDQEVVQPIEDDMSFSQLRAGESLLEIHLKVKTLT